MKKTFFCLQPAKSRIGYLKPFSFWLLLYLFSVTPSFSGQGQTRANMDKESIHVIRQEKRITLRGIITDHQGEPLPGVSVIEKNTRRGTVTNENGVYTLTNVVENGIVAFSFLGMKTEEIEIKGQTEINLQMEEEIHGLQEVVAIGYASQQRSDLTSAVSSMDFSSIEDMPIIDINSALSGQMAGVNIFHSTGTPGGGVEVQIRGLSTLGASSRPLYVIDGLPIQESLSSDSDPLSSLNPSDIASVDILKDASAAAIYGSRASNGVVLITTKVGLQQKAKIDFSAKIGFQEVFNSIDVLSAQEFAELAMEARNNLHVERGGDINDPDDVRNNNMKLGYFRDFLESGAEGTDWQKALFRLAPYQDYQLSVSGGTNNAQYLVSGGFISQDGVMMNTGFDRYSFRANVNVDLTNKLKLTVRLNPTFTTQDFLPAAGRYHEFYSGIVQAAVLMNPLLPIYDENNPHGFSHGIAQGNNLQNIENPIARASLIKDKRDHMQLIGNAVASYSILDGLDFSVTAGTRLWSRYDNRLLPSTIGSYSIIPPRDNMIITSTFFNRNWQLAAQLQYQKRIRRHNITALLVYEMQEDVRKLATARADGTWSDDIITVDPNVSADLRQGHSTINEWALLSYIGRVNYHYHNKYYLTGSLRFDGSSRFAKKWGTFPSISGAWRISREDFMSDIHWLSNLRLRTSYGATGNNSIGSYAQYALMGAGSYPLGTGTGEINSGVSLAGYSNPNLTWEKTDQFDVGLDLALFRGRLAFEVDWYNKRTRDLLLDMQLPGASGFYTLVTNIGKIENKGWEFTVRANSDLGQVRWNSNFNIAFNKQKVLALGEADEPLYGSSLYFTSSHVTRVGSSIGQFYGLKVIGVYNDWDEIASMPSVEGNAGSRPGEFIFEDVDGDGTITLEDRTIIGDPNPDFTFGFTNNFSYKNVSLRIFLRGSVGGDVLNMNFAGNRYTMATNQHKNMLNRWQSAENPGDGMTARVLRANRGDLGSTTLNSDFIEDASFLNIQNVTLNYTLPKKIANNLHVDNIRFFSSIQNLYMFTNYTAFNPEGALNAGATLVPGSDWGTYPLSRTYTLGLNITF